VIVSVELRSFFGTFMMRKPVNLLSPLNRPLKSTVSWMQPTAQVSVRECPEKRFTLFHISTASTTKNFF
jgi:hypothetical protein